MGTQRSTEEVVQSHLAYRQYGDLEWDLRLNYAPDVVLLCPEGIHHGHDGVRHLAHILGTYIDGPSCTYQQIISEGEVGMLVWSGSTGALGTHDGVESYVVREGLIAAQTIQYPASRLGGIPEQQGQS